MKKKKTEKAIFLNKVAHEQVKRLILCDITCHQAKPIVPKRQVTERNYQTMKIDFHPIK